MKRLRIEHKTAFAYPDDVTSSYNEVRMLPGTTDTQFVLSSSLEVHPPAAVNTYHDWFGTRVTAFDLPSPHSELRIVSRALVEVRPRPVAHASITWDDLSREATRDLETVEMLAQTDRTCPHAEVEEIARAIADQHANPGEAAHAIAQAVGDAMSYVPGSTGVQTTAAEAWAARAGVCQDITHIAVGALRSVGIPARYVSGYLHPHVEPAIGEAVAGESHAWVEWWAGDWQACDPTNGVEIGDRHVLVGRGRDYDDVAPLRGVYAGPQKSFLDVSVTITREA